jgi:ABC-2 type transport system permease protein
MNTLAYEWTKLRSVRSTWVAVAATVLSGVALSILGASDVLGGSAADLPTDWDPTAASLKGFLFAQLVIGMLGALAIAPEFASGMVGTSLSFVPARSRLLAAKAAVVAAVAVLTALVTTAVSFTAVQLMLSSADLPAAGLGDPGVPRALGAAVFYLSAVALLGVAVGTIARSTASSLAILVGALLLVPALAPGIVGDSAAKFWPITAAQSAYTTLRLHDTVAPAVGIALLAVTAVLVTAASHALFRARDV